MITLLKKLNYDPSLLMASFNIKLFFTSIPLQETIDYCVNVLFQATGAYIKYLGGGTGGF